MSHGVIKEIFYSPMDSREDTVHENFLGRKFSQSWIHPFPRHLPNYCMRLVVAHSASETGHIPVLERRATRYTASRLRHPLDPLVGGPGQASLPEPVAIHYMVGLLGEQAMLLVAVFQIGRRQDPFAGRDKTHHSLGGDQMLSIYNQMRRIRREALYQQKKKKRNEIYTLKTRNQKLNKFLYLYNNTVATSPPSLTTSFSSSGSIDFLSLSSSNWNTGFGLCFGFSVISYLANSINQSIN